MASSPVKVCFCGESKGVKVYQAHPADREHLFCQVHRAAAAGAVNAWHAAHDVPEAPEQPSPYNYCTVRVVPGTTDLEAY